MIWSTLLSLVTNLTVLMATADSGSPWWVSLIVSIVSPLFYLLVNIGLNALITHLKKKGDLTNKQAKDLQSKVDDYADNGKIDNSNKEDKDDNK